MSETHTDADVDLEALLADDVPCGGIGTPWMRRDCYRPAALRSRGHGCGSPSSRLFKCLQCWQYWYVTHSRLLAEQGSITCGTCRRQFPSVEAFSDYRPF